MNELSRRAWLQTTAIAFTATSTCRAASKVNAFPPIRRITTGPKFHWFGYYDKQQFDVSGRFVLSNRVDFEHRSPRPNDEIDVGMIDTANDDRWIDLGTSKAWNWQQGCMLQWRPGFDDEVLWNDRTEKRFVCRIKNTKTDAERVISSAVYCVSNDGKWGLAADFRRLNDCRPGYGYAGILDPNADVLAPKDAGIWKVDLETGSSKLIIRFADVAGLSPPDGYSPGSKHWFNHLLISPDDRRFIFLHRWRGEAEKKGWRTRMFTCNSDGSGLHLLIPSGRVSHFIWRDAEHILAYAGLGITGKEWRFQVFKDRSDQSEVIAGLPTYDGHCTYLPGNEWILNDSYPDRSRLQTPYLFHVGTKNRIDLGKFLSPKTYTGEWRCDLHPRISRDGTKVVIDSPHEAGRQQYLIDVSEIVRKG